MLDAAYVGELTAVGGGHGLAAVGVAPAEPFSGTRVDLEERRAAGLHGGMQFTYRNPERSTTPTAALVGAQALVVGALAYRDPDGDRPKPAGSDPQARVARYAWRDHYAVLREALAAVAGRLERDGYRARVLADDNALVDREAAYRAGLGWYGKNSNLLLPGQGSWFVLGSVLTDAPLPVAAGPVADGCGSCTRCITGCPTGAIVAPGVVDARRCLAWLVQAPGTFPAEFRVALGDRLYGCDDCQEVCPPNRRADRDVEGVEGADTGPTASGEAQSWVDVLDLLSATDDELLARHGRWYIAARNPAYLRRNALVVLGNSGRPGDARVQAALARYLVDPEPLLRAHAVWAARRLGLDSLLDACRTDRDPEVRAELERPAPPVAVRA